jgi:hypothetical protein
MEVSVLTWYLHYSQIPKKWKQTKFHQWINGIDTIYIYIDINIYVYSVEYSAIKMKEILWQQDKSGRY